MSHESCCGQIKFCKGLFPEKCFVYTVLYFYCMHLIIKHISYFCVKGFLGHYPPPSVVIVHLNIQYDALELNVMQLKVIWPTKKWGVGLMIYYMTTKLRTHAAA